MPYAANNQISQSPIEGGIQITEQQYQAALNAMQEGKTVLVDSGLMTFGPAPEPDPEPPVPLSVRSFRARFAREEQIAIREASLTDMDVGLVYDDFMSAQYIDLSDPAVESGIDLYISKGLIDPARKAELMEANYGA